VLSEDVLVWLMYHGLTLFEDNPMFHTNMYIACLSYPRLLQLLKDHAYSWNDKVTLSAATKGNLTALNWLVVNKCPWNKVECFKQTSDQTVRDWIGPVSAKELKTSNTHILQHFHNDTEASKGGIDIGEFYRNNNSVMVRIM